MQIENDYDREVYSTWLRAGKPRSNWTTNPASTMALYSSCMASASASAKRDRKAALRFLLKAIGQHGTPVKITIDKSGVNTAAGVARRRGNPISVVTMGANLTTVDDRIEAIKRWRDVYNSVVQS